MPCDTITTQSVALKNAMPELVKKTLEALGWTITTSTKTTISAKNGYDSLNWTKGQGMNIRIQSNQQTLQTITKTYSGLAVTWAASRAGWDVSVTGTDTLTISRR